MTSRRLAAVDAQMYWMASAIPNDQFLVYGFDGELADPQGFSNMINGRG